MSSYDRILDLSRERLKADQFHPLREMGRLTTREMVHFSSVFSGEWDLDHNTKDHNENVRSLEAKGLREAKKASIVFGRVEDSVELLAVPIVSSKQESAEAWHDSALNDYMNRINLPDSFFTPTTIYPDMLSGTALRLQSEVKPMLYVHARCSSEDLDMRMPLLKRLSTDFPEAVLCISASYKKFFVFDDGSVKNIDIDC